MEEIDATLNGFCRPTGRSPKGVADYYRQGGYLRSQLREPKPRGIPCDLTGFRFPSSPWLPWVNRGLSLLNEYEVDCLAYLTKDKGKRRYGPISLWCAGGKETSVFLLCIMQTREIGVRQVIQMTQGSKTLDKYCMEVSDHFSRILNRPKYPTPLLRPTG